LVTVTAAALKVACALGHDGRKNSTMQLPTDVALGGASAEMFREDCDVTSLYAHRSFETLAHELRFNRESDGQVLD